MLNFKEIFKAWVSASNPTTFQKELAESRLDICTKCPYKKEVFDNKKWAAICGQCGCPLKGKIFSDVFNACPMNYWKNVDESFGLNTKPKNDSTFI
jgi:hypothetical protein